MPYRYKHAKVGISPSPSPDRRSPRRCANGVGVSRGRVMRRLIGPVVAVCACLALAAASSASGLPRMPTSDGGTHAPGCASEGRRWLHRSSSESTMTLAAHGHVPSDRTAIVIVVKDSSGRPSVSRGCSSNRRYSSRYSAQKRSCMYPLVALLRGQCPLGEDGVALGVGRMEQHRRCRILDAGQRGQHVHAFAFRARVAEHDAGGGLDLPRDVGGDEWSAARSLPSAPGGCPSPIVLVTAVGRGERPRGSPGHRLSSAPNLVRAAGIGRGS